MNALPARVAQDAAFAAHRLADEERFRLGMEQAGRVELDELHVGDGHARAVGHGHAVAGGDVGIGGVEIDLAAAAGGEEHVLRGDGLDPAAWCCRARRRRRSGCPWRSRACGA